MSDLWQVGLVLALVAINAAFAGSELALLSLRETQIARLESASSGGRALGRLARDPNRYLATIQIGITLAGFLASATAAVSLAAPLIPVLEPFGDADEALAIMLVTLALTFLTLVFGELAPKRIALQHAEGWATVVARPLDLLARVARPAVWLLSISTNIVVRLAGTDPSRSREEVTEEHLREMVAGQASLSADERAVITGALEVGERRLRDILIPRTDVFALPAELSAAAAAAEILESGHTRAPVFRGSLDEMVGVVHLRDLFGATGTAGDLASPTLTLPDSSFALPALREMQRTRQQMALVADEYGGIEGIITIEDLVEEVVGEIYDEHDIDVTSAVRDADGAFLLPGGFPVHDLVDLSIALPHGRFTTVAGFIIERLGRIPAEGDSVEESGWRFVVTESSSTRITRVKVDRIGDG